MIFISYSHKDQAAAAKLKADLKAAHFDAFLAHDDVNAGSDWHLDIWRELKGCHGFVGLLTENFNASAFRQQEVGAALGLEKPHLLVVDGSKRNTVPGFAARFQTVKRSKLVSTLNTSAKFRMARIAAWIEGTKTAKDYAAANVIFRQFRDEWDEMKTPEKLRWLKAAARNTQVYGDDWHVGPFCRRAARNLKPHLTKEWLDKHDSQKHVRRLLRRLRHEED